MGSMVKELKYSKLMEWFTRRHGPLSADLRLVRSAADMNFNVKPRAFTACSGRIYTAAAWAVGLKSNGGRALTC